LGWLRCPPFRPVAIRKGAEISIGRQDGCDLVLPHSSVSRRHATVKGLDRLVFRDLDSANGSALNGQPFRQGPLADGDVLKLGPFEVVVRSSADTTGDLDRTNRVLPVSARDPDALSGLLRDMPLTELLQSMELNQKSGTLTVTTEGGKGTIVVRGGRPQFARYGELTDDAAVIALLRTREGRFVLAPLAEPGEATMTTPLMSLLLEASRQADEG